MNNAWVRFIRLQLRQLIGQLNRSTAHTSTYFNHVHTHFLNIYTPATNRISEYKQVIISVVYGYIKYYWLEDAIKYYLLIKKENHYKKTYTTDIRYKKCVQLIKEWRFRNSINFKISNLRVKPGFPMGTHICRPVWPT